MTPTTISPTALLERLTSPTVPAPQLILLTGESGAGKTSACLELLSLARAAGLHPVGLVSPAVFDAGIKIGIDLMDVVSGERRRLAVWRPEPASTPETGVLPLHWRFDPQVIAWGNRILAGLPASELLLLDEIGPLEFHFAGGLTDGLQRLDARLDRTACVVIRPVLLDAAQARWPWALVWAAAGTPPETNPS